jgi:hypothetical protein
MLNNQRMQNYDYFDILYFKDRSDRDPTPRSRSFFFFSDRDLGVGSQSGKILDRELQH